MEGEPTDDNTPQRVPISDHGWFTCPHCGRAVRCPPVAMPVEKDTTALVRRAGDPAPELDPGTSTRITKLPDLVVELDLPKNKPE